jgi:hypothetical protein
VNTFVLYAVKGTDCGSADIEMIPRTFRAVLSSPFYLDSLPLAPKDAQALLKQMDGDNNTDHIIHARFNIRIVYIEPLRKEVEKRGSDINTHYRQSNVEGHNVARLDARLESIDFYEDLDHTKLVYQFQP